jgi:hypothetical protein
MPLSPPPPSWELLARNHIPGRDWKFVSNIWAAAALGFELASISELSQDIEPIVGPGFERRATVSVFEFPDGHVAAFHDAAVALSKCAYVLRTVGNCLLGGQPTWPQLMRTISLYWDVRRYSRFWECTSCTSATRAVC